MSQFQHLLPFFHFTINIVLNYETISVVCFSFTLHFIKPYLKNWVFTYPEKTFQVFNELIFFSFASHMTASLFIAVGYFFLHKTLPLGQGTESAFIFPSLTDHYKSHLSIQCFILLTLSSFCPRFSAN